MPPKPSKSADVKKPAKATKLSTKLRQAGVVVPKEAKRTEPVWEGPCSAGPQGGITQSLLSAFLCCRERFRLRVVEGLATADQFNHHMEYGSMWHVCEEAYASAAGDHKPKTAHEEHNWQFQLKEYAKKLVSRYRLQAEQIEHWYNVCKAQFPIYVDYWKKHEDEKHLVPVLQEQVFHVPYRLPSGRVVYLRGKWDGADLVGKGKAAALYLKENKTKGNIDEAQLKRQLQFDFQTMIYFIAFLETDNNPPPTWKGTGPGGIGAKGIRYNVVRRPLSGGKGSIRQHQPTKSNPLGESKEAFYARLAGIIEEEPEYFFMRWRVEITPADVERFKREFLNPILEQLCDWWEWITKASDPFNPNDGCEAGPTERSVSSSIHWRHPHGVYNVLNEGGSTELDEYIATGSTVGLQRSKPLFGELEE